VARISPAQKPSADPSAPTLDSINGGSSTLELDHLIHARARLGIVSSLAVKGSLAFTGLRELLGVTDGNLMSHVNKLEQAGYVACTKTFDGGVQKTEYRLTRTGKREFEAYLDHMEAIIRATRPPQER